MGKKTVNRRRKSTPNVEKSTRPRKTLKTEKPTKPISTVIEQSLLGVHPNLGPIDGPREWTRFEKVEFLYCFVDDNPDFIVGDDMGTLFNCMKTILVACLVLDTTSAEVISYVTCYPELFVSAVLFEFDRLNIHLTYNCQEGVLSRDQMKDIATISTWAHELQEDFWNVFWTYKDQIALDTLRNRVLFGGGVQDWVDIDAVYRFGLQDRVRNANGEGLASLTDTQLIVSQMKPLFGRARTAH